MDIYVGKNWTPAHMICRTQLQKIKTSGTSLVIQWLRLWASNEGDMGCIPGWGSKIPHAPWCGKTKKEIKKKKKEKIKNLDSKQNGKIFSPELKDPSFRTWRRENFLKQAMKTLTIKYKIDNLTTLSFRIFFPKENLRK